jgi:TfoX/Sxy family transcriptional regulator of competence genes
MAYDEQLADRVRPILRADAGADERKMFGGIAFLINGNMACGVHTDNLIVRLDRADYEEALTRPGAAVFDLTGKPMKGWVLVSPDALEDDAELGAWVRQGMEFAQSLPPK